MILGGGIDLIIPGADLSIESAWLKTPEQKAEFQRLIKPLVDRIDADMQVHFSLPELQ